MRFIVLASSMAEVHEWRRSQGLRERDVIGVTPGNARTALRGLAGNIELVVSETWEGVPSAVALSVQRDLEIIRVTSPGPSPSPSESTP